MVGEDGFTLLDALEAPDVPEAVRQAPSITTLRRAWQRHYERTAGTGATPKKRAVPRVRFKANRDLPPAAEGMESPYDPEARYRQKRDTQWTGYMVHVSETCEPTAPHLLTHVHTTAATVHEAQCTIPIQQALVEKALPRASIWSMRRISAPRCWSRARTSRGSLCGGRPGRPKDGRRRSRAYTIEQFEVDWAQQRVRCPQGKWSVAWWDQGTRARSRRSSWSLPLKIASPVPPGRSARERSSRADAWGYRPRTSTRRCERPRCGIAVRRARRAINNEPGSKEPSRRVSGALGCGAPDIGV